jgi:broad specificity phosphatase PhoE
MPKLVLIKHSLPEVRSEHPPSRWRLSPEGSRLALELAEELRPLGLTHLHASREPKASQTAALIAERLGIPWEARDGLEEHHRDHEPFLAEADFRAKVAAFFARPNERVFGEETATEALTRFEDAITGLWQAAADTALTHPAADNRAAAENRPEVLEGRSGAGGAGFPAREDIAIVAHGTVISLLVASKCHIDAFDLWRRLGLPSYVVLETPSWRLVEVVEELDA